MALSTTPKPRVGEYPPPPGAIAPRCFTRAVLADEFRLSRTTVTTRLRDAGVAPAGWEGKSEVYRLRDVMGVLTGKDATPSGDEYDLSRFSSASERKAFIDGEIKLVELRKINRELVPRIEAVRAMSTGLAPVVALLAGLSSRLETELGIIDESLLSAVEEWERGVRSEVALVIEQALEQAPGANDGE